LKSFYCEENENKKIIDSNEAVTLKLEQIRKTITNGEQGKGGFSLGLKPENVEELLEGEDGENVLDDEHVAEHMKTFAEAQAAYDMEMSEDMKQMADNIISEAKAQAKSIVQSAEMDAARLVADARNDADAIKDNAHNEGFEAGRQDGIKSLDDDKKRLNEEYDEKERLLKAEYAKRSKDLEPELVDIMIDVFSSITKELASEQKDMILTLIDKVISGTEASSNYIIRVCREDAQFLRDNRENVLKRINRDVHLEIVEDVSMKRNECLVDTDLGIYDCSLDIQLENLIKSLKILSCVSEKS
jgi:flagellar assembly protein FliH